MKVMAIKNYALLLVPMILFANFFFSSPDRIFAGKEANVTLEVENAVFYDVKIFIEDNKSKIISEIYDERMSWKSSFYYIKNISLVNNSFRLRVKDSEEGDYKICTRLKKTDSEKYYELCHNITLIIPPEQESVELNKTDSPEDFESRDYKIREYMFLGFCGLCLLILILLIKDRL